jgi:hypothetical protein
MTFLPTLMKLKRTHSMGNNPEGRSFPTLGVFEFIEGKA